MEPIMVLSLLAATFGTMLLPAEQQAIALQVADQGLPACRMYYPDGSEGPCLPTFTVDRSPAVNSTSLAGHITITQGALDRLTPDEFALLAGHEIAHWYLGHHGSSVEAELAADRLGATLACRAGYDMTRAVSIYRFVGRGRDHPAPTQRRAAVLAVDCQGARPLGTPATLSR